MRTPDRLSLREFLQIVAEQPIDRPLVIDFEPSHPDANQMFQIIRRYDHGDRDTEHLGSRELAIDDLIDDGGALYESLDASSVASIKTGTWLTWPGMVSDFHRDWFVWSVVNFMFCGEKLWHIVDRRDIRPHHANLVLSGTNSIISKVESGRIGYGVVQRENECIYLPGGYYHRVTSNEFSLSYSMWWTWHAQLLEHGNITDTWWLNLLRKQRCLKPERAPDVEAAYFRRPALERMYCQQVHNRYLRLCDRLNARKLERYHERSRMAAQRMQKLLQCESLESARRVATSMA
jgi:hypothetical protein